MHHQTITTAREWYLLDNYPAETVRDENDAFLIFTIPVKVVVARLCDGLRLVFIVILRPGGGGGRN